MNPTQSFLLFLFTLLLTVSHGSVSAFFMNPVFGNQNPLRSKDHDSFKAAVTATETIDNLKVRERSYDSVDLSDYTRILQLTAKALRHVDGASGLESLRTLARMCRYRTKYDFVNEPAKQSDGAVVQFVPQLLSEQVLREVNERLDFLASQGWLSTNPDSVDGLPSFHLNLISNGQPVSEPDVAENPDVPKEFVKELQKLTDLVAPIVYERLLPMAQELLREETSSLKVQDVFLRRYGINVMQDEARMGISAHYDVYSHLTAVCALDNTARNGDNGLFTTAFASKIESSVGSTSNHAALRRFFPLRQGDAVLHTWNVLHGVDVQGNETRSSLVIWFTSDDESQAERPEEQGKKLSFPWLNNRRGSEADDVAQFVMGSALESSSAEATTFTNDDRIFQETYEHYFKSASNGNTFALTRLGSLCEEGKVSSRMHELDELLNILQGHHRDLHQIVCCSLSSSTQNIAKRCWLEGALRGNPLAQSSLADELMFEGTEQQDAQKRLLATTLFALAAQQGDEGAKYALQRVLAYESAHGEEYIAKKILSIIEAAILG